jgi:hypothetical protein
MLRLPRPLATLLLLIVATALTASPALARKRDHDRLPDRWEKKHHLNLKRNDADRDRDRDGLSNYGEYRSRTNPRKKDSDRDGRRDRREDHDRDKLANGLEIRFGFDPGDRDSDDDGIKDGRENAGKLTKVSATSVTIKLAVGGRLAARIGEELAVDCGSPPAGDPPAPGDDAEDDLPADDGDPSEDDAGDEASDAEDADLGEDAVAAQLPEDELEDGPGDEALDDEAFDRQFEDDFAAGETDCATSALKAGARVHEATIRRTGSGPVLVALELVR